MAQKKARSTKECEEKPKTEVNIDLGLGGIFKGLGDFIDVLSDMAEKGEAETSRTGEFKVKGLGDKGRGVYGFSVRTGIGGIPEVQRFGNIRATERGPEVAEVREPLVDVFDEKKEFVVVAELPGVNEEEITIDVRDDILALETTGERKYEKEILLPETVEQKKMTRTFKNGILELRMKKAA
jgi:HSP20 family protein